MKHSRTMMIYACTEPIYSRCTAPSLVLQAEHDPQREVCLSLVSLICQTPFQVRLARLVFGLARNIAPTMLHDCNCKLLCEQTAVQFNKLRMAVAISQCHPDFEPVISHDFLSQYS